MLLLFTFGVQLLATEKNVWNTISYNPPIIVYWQVAALEKDLCLHPFCHTNFEPSGHKIHQDPCTWGKNAPRNASKQILLGNYFVSYGHVCTMFLSV